MTRAELHRLLLDERYGLIELLEMERDLTRHARAVDPAPIPRGHLMRRRDALRAAATACEAQHGK